MIPFHCFESTDTVHFERFVFKLKTAQYLLVDIQPTAVIQNEGQAAHLILRGEVWVVLLHVCNKER